MAGVLLVPYYNLQLFRNLPTTHEAGTYVKFPFNSPGAGSSASEDELKKLLRLM